MAAAMVSTRGRGVAGGPLFLFTLLCLVCLASSQTDAEKLKTIKENVQRVQQNLDALKAQKAALLEGVGRYSSYIEQQLASLKKDSEESPEDFPPLEGFLEHMKGLLDENWTFVDGKNREIDAETARIEQEQGEMMKIIKCLENHKIEL